MFNFDSKREVREAFRAGNRARKKEAVQDTIESVDDIQAQIDLFKEQTGKELEIRDGRPYFDGNLDLESCTELTSLPAGMKVKGDLDLDKCIGLTSLPGGLEVNGYLALTGCTGLTGLPNGLKVGGGLILTDCTGLTGLPAGLEVNGYLRLNNCTGLTSLPNGLKVEGDLSLRGCTGLTSLPVGLEVEGLLNLTGCTGLISLPDGMKVGESLYMEGCTGLTSLPFDLVVFGWIVHKGILTPFFKKLGIPVDKDGNTKTSNWWKWQKANGYLTEAFKTGNRARKKESIHDTVDSIDDVRAQIDLFRKQTGIELEIRDGKPYCDHCLQIIHGAQELTSLPDGLTIDGSLFLRNCNKMTSLPSDLTIYGNYIRDIPDSLLPFFEEFGVKVHTVYRGPGSDSREKTHTVRAKDWMDRRHLIDRMDEAFRAGNRARKKETVQDTVESVGNIQEQIDIFEKQTGYELDIKDGRPYADYWGGGLVIENCAELTSLPDGLITSFSLFIENCINLTSLPVGLTVGGKLYLKNCPSLTSLPVGLTVELGLILKNCPELTSLPVISNVKNDLVIENCLKLTSLPAVLNVKNSIGASISITLSDCPELTSLPDSLTVDCLTIERCSKLTSLPQDLTVENWMDLENCTGLTSLPRGLTVKSLHLNGCTGLTSLPSDLTVSNSQYIYGIPDSLRPFMERLGIKVNKKGDISTYHWMKKRHLADQVTEAFKAGNRARKKEAVQDGQTDNIDTIDNLEDLLDVCDKIVRLYSGREHQFPKGWVFGTDGSGVNPPEITESPVNNRQYLRNWLVKYRYDFNGDRIRNDLAKEIPGDGNHKFDSDWDIIHSNGRATHLNFDYTVGVMKKKDEDGYRIIFNDGINEACIYMPGYSRSSFGMALMHLFGAAFMKRYIKAAYYQGVNDPLGDENYKEAVQMIIRLFTEAVPMSVWKPGQVISVEIGQEPVYTNNDFTK